jgi:predicted phosphoribosyltransferase
LRGLKANERVSIDIPDFRDRVRVFRDRAHAGELLADLLAPEASAEPILLAIPAGGVPVAVELCRRRGWPLDVAVVSKITPAWNPEVGYGAVAFDGTVHVDPARAATLGVSLDEVARGTARARAKVERRVGTLRGGRTLALTGRAVILVDDGLASGTTMRVAVAAVRRSGAGRIVVAVPTAHVDAVEALAPEVDALYVANLRRGWSFAVADAYREWHDVSDQELAETVARL